MVTPEQLIAPDTERDDVVSRLEAELAGTRLQLEDARAQRRAAESRARTAEAAILAVRSVVDAVD